MVGVGGQRRGVHVDRLRGAEAVLVHVPDARVEGDAVHPGVRGDRHAHLPGHLERGLLRERRVVAGDVEGDREPLHVALAVEPADVEVPELRRGAPLPRALLDVPVGQHEPPARLLQGVGGGVGVLGRLQPVRPVHRGRHAGVDRLDGRQQVPGVDVLRAELLAPVQVVPDEVLGQGPVGPVGPHGRLPHVPVGVDHARHDDAAGRVDLRGAVGHLQVRADRRDPLPGDQHIGVGQDPVPVVHGEHRRVAENQRPSRYQVRCRRHRNLHYRR